MIAKIWESRVVWIRALSRLMHEEHGFLGPISPSENVEKLRLKATRFYRFQYHIARGQSFPSCNIQYCSLCNDQMAAISSMIRCTEPFLCPGGRFLLSAMLDSKGYFHVLCWDLALMGSDSEKPLRSIASLRLENIKYTWGQNKLLASLVAQYDPQNSTVMVLFTTLCDLT